MLRLFLFLISLIVTLVSGLSHALSTSKSTFTASEPILVETDCQDLPEGSWVGLFSQGAENAYPDRRNYKAIRASSNCIRRFRPQAPGRYEVRQFNGPDFDLQASVAITVVESPDFKKLRKQRVKETVTFSEETISEVARERCLAVKAENLNSMVECMAAARTTKQWARGIYHSGGKIPGCRHTAEMFQAILEEAQMPATQMANIKPSCAQFSHALTKMGQPPNWGGCVGSHPSNAAQCLADFYVIQNTASHDNSGSGIVNASRLLDCQQMQNDYAKVLAATTVDNSMPGDYEALACNQVDQVKAKMLAVAELRGRCQKYISGGNHAIYHCLKQYNPDIESDNCEVLKTTYHQALTTAYGNPKPYSFPNDCSVLANLIKVNSKDKDYKEQRQLQQAQADRERQILAQQQLEQMDVEFEQYQDKVQGLSLSLTGLAQLVEDEKAYELKYQQHSKWKRNLYRRHQVRVAYANRLANQLIKQFNQADTRQEIIDFRQRYFHPLDWSSPELSRAIVRGFKQKEDAINPFSSRLSQSDYLNAIYWQDIETMRAIDGDLMKGIQKAHKASTALFDGFVDKMASAFFKGAGGASNTDLNAFRNMERTASLLKFTVNSYLSRYQDYYSACLRADHVTHVHYLAAIAPTETRDGFGTVVRRTEGAPEVRIPYRINREFQQLANWLNITKPDHSSGGLATLGFSFFDQRLGAEIQQARTAMREIDESVQAIMGKQPCDSDKIKTFEASLLASFSTYFDL